MQERKNKRLLILAGLLLVSSAVVYWFVQPRDRLNIDVNAFQVEDFKTIDKIILESPSDTVSLAFNGTRWRVNDQYDADGNMINVLFATLQQARPKRSVGSQRDSIYHHSTEAGVKVSLLNGDGLQKQFFAAGNSAKTQAYFSDPASQEVYVVSIPGYRVYVSGIFEMEEDGWRDKTVFAINWRNFKSLDATFPKTPAENFTVALNNGFFGIKGLDTDTLKLNAFFDNLFALTADEFVASPGLKDSLGGVMPLAQFTVTDVGNRTYRLALFTDNMQTNALGIIPASDVAIFSRGKIQPLLRPKSFFKKK